MAPVDTLGPQMIREPAVAGQFYPADSDHLRAVVERYLRLGAAGPGETSPRSVLALVVPHAGYVYSGLVAGAVYAVASLPERLVILCPNHTGRGEPVGLMREGVWRTPLGDARVDGRLADQIMEACPLVAIDEVSHEREHALEVQIPFLQAKLGPALSFVPICVGTHRLDDLTALGKGIARAIQAGQSEGKRGAAIIISTDMSHYIPADLAREKDMMAIGKIKSLDPEGLHRVVHEQEISMCGVAPAVAGLTAARILGSREARLVAYANSGDTSGDFGAVVGYAGLTIS